MPIRVPAALPDALWRRLARFLFTLIADDPEE